jgi:hypothetical protein
MDYNLNIISRNQIPPELYLCERSKNKEWELIHLFEFENGLKCILGANFTQQVDDIIESIKNEMDYIINIDTPDELQEYYYNEFESFYKYKDCVKIWNYYHSNQNLIREVINSYNIEDEGIIDN